MAEESGQSVLSVFFTHILPLVPGAEGRLEAGTSLLDLGCGRGRALLMLAERFPNSRFHGFDLSIEAVSHAAGEAEARRLSRSSTRSPCCRVKGASATAQPARDLHRWLPTRRQLRRGLDGGRRLDRGAARGPRHEEEVAARRRWRS
jgi:SAM-dependent methyltransferase